MGQLAYVAVFYDHAFGLGPGPFSLIWTLSGFSFFVGNWFGGKILRSIESQATAVAIMVGAAVVGTISIVVLFTSPYLALSAAMTSVTAASHAVIAACVTTLLVRRAEGRRGAVLSLNAAGQSLGVFLGAAIAGAGLAAADWPGMAMVLAVVTALSAIVGATVYVHARGESITEKSSALD